jgi:hypothetical protein
VGGVIMESELILYGVDFKKIIKKATPYWIDIIINRLEVVKAIYTVFNLGGGRKFIQPTEIFEIIDYKGERNTDTYTDYCKLCSTVWDKLGGKELNSSNASHSNFTFISQLVQHLAEISKDKLIADKNAKIKQLKNDIERLTTELEEEQNKPL